MTEVVDIVVKESGSAAAATNVRAIGGAAATTRAQMDQLLLTMNGSNMKLAEIARATGSVEQQMQNLGRSTRVAAEGHKVHNEHMAHGTELAGRAREALVALGLALGVHEWIELTDAYQRNVNGLLQVTTSQENLVSVQKALRQVSMDTFSSLDANTNLFVRLTKAGKDLNLTQEDMITVIRVLNDGLRLAGNSTESAGRAISQLSIAMMTGEGSSRAMMAIMRQMPDLTQAIAAKFFTGHDAVQRFKQGVEGNTISIQQVIRAITTLSSQQDTLAIATAEVTGVTHKAAAALQTEAEAEMIASGRMIDLSKATFTGSKNFIDLSKSADNAAHSMTDIDNKVTHTGHSLAQASTEIQKVGPTAVANFGRAHGAIQQADSSLTKFEQNVKKVEPTIANAWTQMKSALFAYVGEADQASGASEKIAHWLTFAAQNGKVFFGVIGVITAFLGTYAAVAGIAAASTFLFVSAFSRIALAVSIVTALVVAIYTFGQSIKITADGTISAMGAVLGVFDLVKQGVMALWNLAMQAPGYWGPAVIAVGGLVVALRVLLGVNLLTWLAQATFAMGAFALSVVTALGPWGLLIAGIIAAALAWAYYNGTLDSAIDTLKEKLTPVVNGLVEKMKEFTKVSEKAGTSAKDFGRAWNEELSRVTDGFKDGLLPAVKKTDEALEKLKRDAVSDMGAAKAAISDVASAFNAVTSSANQTDASVNKVATNATKATEKQQTLMFATWNTPDVMKSVGNAWQRAAEISIADGVQPPKDYDNAAGLFRGFVDDPMNNQRNKAEIVYILSKLSDNARTYLRNTTVGGWMQGFANGGSFRVGGNGGTDSQLVQFMASPNETVSVQTPQQASGGGGGRNVTVHMTVVANDAQSFQRTSRQLVTQLQSQLQRVANKG